jgi:glucoamylase
LIRRRQRPAPGGPGIEPRWTRGAKDAVGTAYSTSSRLWYTFSAGCINEVYYPTIDKPQIRDLQLLFTDGQSFFHDERRHFTCKVDCVSEAALGFHVTNTNREKDYWTQKFIIGDPHQNCLLMHTRIMGDSALLAGLKVYVLCAPHLEIGGWHNNGEVLEVQGRQILMAQKGGTWLVLGASTPFLKCSCGYVGVNDGWTDVSRNLQMSNEFDCAFDGNIALTAQIDLSARPEFTIGLAFGTTLHDAVTTLVQSVSAPFDVVSEHFVGQWDRTSKRFHLLENLASRDSRLFSRSVNLLLAHEDKTYPGAMIAALSIPWGSHKSDEALGGYHLVWTRDMVNGASALLAVGDKATPLRALIYLSVAQSADGGFYQNFWIDGEPFWSGVQLDEVSFPVILAWRLRQAQALAGFDAYTMVLRAIGCVIREGPTTPQDRWEEPCGYSPYTLAVNIAALLCAADFMDDRGDDETAEFVRRYADFLESHVEQWTVTNQGSLVPGIRRHFIRANPATGGDEDPDRNFLSLANQPPGARYQFPAREIVDAGFLELVRYGIRDARDPLIVDSLRVVDAELKVETPQGPCWKRYNHDGYGQRSDGTAYDYWGTGHAWPLLTGERGHYELAAGRDPEPYIAAIEKFASGIGLIPEQIWDGPDLPARNLFLGGQTGAAIPLMWAHAEYIKLLRSHVDRRVFDLIEPVVRRYRERNDRLPIEVWKAERKVHGIFPGTTLRVVAREAFMLHWTVDNWRTVNDTRSVSTAIGLDFADIQNGLPGAGTILFTFLWVDENRWEGIDYKVEVRR